MKNNYERYLKVEEHLHAVMDAAASLAKFDHFCNLSKREWLEALHPGWSSDESRKMKLWESATEKDERRSVKILYADYQLVKAELVALLASN